MLHNIIYYHNGRGGRVARAQVAAAGARGEGSDGDLTANSLTILNNKAWNPKRTLNFTPSGEIIHF